MNMINKSNQIKSNYSTMDHDRSIHRVSNRHYRNIPLILQTNKTAPAPSHHATHDKLHPHDISRGILAKNKTKGDQK